MRKKRKMAGTLSLEAALTLPLVLLLLFTFLGLIQGEEDSLILAHALDQTARETALLLPLADMIDDLGDPLALIRDLIPDEALARLALDGLSDMAGTVLASPLLLERVDLWARATASARSRRPPGGARRLALDFDQDRRSIWLLLSFEHKTLLHTEWRTVRSRIPLWNRGSLLGTEDREGNEDADSVWLLHNFERGAIIREKFGGCLPEFYPVIAAWDGREALAIKSMDWTAPTWSDPAAVKKRLDGFVADLAAFEGAGSPGPQTGEIQMRRLILVIPDNAIAWKTAGLLDSWKGEADRMGVLLEIREYGTSEAYSPSG